MIQVLRLLRAAAGSDRDLLDRYVRNRDQEAFEALVRRYGTGVWAACVRFAGRDAEDAFQAVFVVLSRKAGSVTGSLPAWLHAVARRVAANLRRSDRRRRAAEASARTPDQPAADPGFRESMALLDEELARMPERYRAVLIVCCLEGRSRDEAAAHLGWSEGQVKGRLERARELLRARLARRGVELGGLLLAAAVAGPAPARARPPSAAAISLTHGVIRAMLFQRLKLVAVLAACVGVALAGGALLTAQPGDSPPAAPNGENPPKDFRLAAAGPQDKEQIDAAARKEIESLRKRIEALEQMRKPPAPESQKVVVTRPVVKDIALTRQYVGRVSAHRHINVSALVGGVVTEVLVKDGQAVKQGDTLFKLLPTLAQAKLEIEMAEVRIAELGFEHARQLADKNVVSKQDLALSEAKLAKAKAQAKLAETELNFTAVRAPFDGLVGRLQPQSGSVVKEGDALTTLSDGSVVRVYFNVPEARYLEYMADQGRVKEGLPVELVLANGKKNAHVGRLAATEGQFNEKTGTIAFRADFPNPDGLLRHGQSGLVVLGESVKNALVIPQSATFEEQGRHYVFVVGKDDVAHRREVGIQNEFDAVFVVGKGLAPDDRIVSEGVRQVRDGEKVKQFEYRDPKAPLNVLKYMPE